MPFVAILGAGDLGGALTYTLASRARFDEVRLIDPAGTAAAGKALDIRQAGPADGSSTRVTGHADIDASRGAWVVVLADPLASKDDPVPSASALLTDVTRLAPAATVVCAHASHAALLPRLVGAGICPPDLLVGSAPAAVASAARALLALACGTSASAVHVSLTTQPESSQPVIDWTRSSVRGRLAGDVLTRDSRDRLDRQLSLAWPPGPLALASAAARCAEAAWFGTRRPEFAWVVDRSLTRRTVIGPTETAPSSAPALLEVVFEPGGRLRLPEDAP